MSGLERGENATMKDPMGFSILGPEDPSSEGVDHERVQR
jgi:hypothetical protein